MMNKRNVQTIAFTPLRLPKLAVREKRSIDSTAGRTAPFFRCAMASRFGQVPVKLVQCFVQDADFGEDETPGVRAQFRIHDRCGSIRAAGQQAGEHDDVFTVFSDLIPQLQRFLVCSDVTFFHGACFLLCARRTAHDEKRRGVLTHVPQQALGMPLKNAFDTPDLRRVSSAA